MTKTSHPLHQSRALHTGHALHTAHSHTHTHADSHSHSFDERVYAAVKQIPRGCVATYGQIAGMIGAPRAARYVGFALHRNPYEGIVPCHRVVFADGSLAPGFLFGGPDEQRKRLESEGVIFLPGIGPHGTARVDLKACRWDQDQIR
jgi:methylated-DNA-protein-cysteine methyltransferase-like protein